MSLDISLNKRYLRVRSETFDRLDVIEDASTITEWFGRGWDGQGVAFTNFAGIVARELYDNLNIVDGGSGWDDAGVNFANFRRIVAVEDYDDMNITNGGTGWNGAGVNW